MSFQPFIDGPGRVNDYVKLPDNIYKILHVEDVLSPRIGYNLANNTWQTTVFNQIAPRFDTTFRNVDITNVTAHRLLQITGIELFTGMVEISLRQPAKMTRWGAGAVAEGTLTNLRSPLGAPLRLRNLYTVNEKPIQLRAVSLAAAHRVRPMFALRGFLYELEVGPKEVKISFEPPLGGIE